MPRVARMLILCDGAAAAMLVDHGSMHSEDLEHISDQVRRAARDCQNGEIEWPLPLARAAVGALAAASRIILGLDIRDYDAEGRFVEVAWSEFEPGISGSLPQAVESSRAAALAALDRAVEHQPWNDPWVVVTW
jgi:hypothetical protein